MYIVTVLLSYAKIIVVSLFYSLLSQDIHVCYPMTRVTSLSIHRPVTDSSLCSFTNNAMSTPYVLV
jgi:hypothetical protein